MNITVCDIELTGVLFLTAPHASIRVTDFFLNIHK